MKNPGVIYEQGSITYWPNYTTIVGCMVLFGLVAIGLATMAILQILCHGIDSIMFSSLAFLVSFLFVYIIIRINGMKEEKVVIDDHGIVVSQIQGFETVHLSWEEVKEIKYEHQSWYGSEWLIISYRKLHKANFTDNSILQYLRLPLRSVEFEKIKQIVPYHIPYN